jgi:predicted Fe-Mo cluster-binding NifX family protein
MMVEMTCWKWFDGVLKEAGVKVTDKNKEKVDEVIHHYIGEQSSYGRCSADWRKARKEIQEDEEMKKELIEKLRVLL